MSEAGTSGPRCDRCRHWGLSNDNEPDAAAWAIPEIAFKACGAIRHRRLYESACGTVEDEQAAMQRARAIVTDGEDYFAIVVTGQDFFCALFQPKEPT